MKTFFLRFIALKLSIAMAFPHMVTVTALSYALMSSAHAATLNLRDANIRTLINTVAKATGRNFIIDPRVNGNVTVLISKDLPPDALYQVFLTILTVHGFVAIEGEFVTKILPASQSKSASAYVSKEAPESLTTTVIPIKYINAQQVIPVLRPFVSPTSFLSVYPPTNVLIIHATLANIVHLKRLVKEMDKPLSSDFEVIRLRHASASEMSKIITTFITKDKNTPEAKTVKIAADLRTNRLIINADDGQRLRIRALVADLDIADVQGDTSVIYLRYADAKQLLPILQGIIGTKTTKAGAKGGAAVAGSVSIQADEATNALIVTAPQDLANQIESLRSVIRRLDIRRAQVLIEAIVAEVNADTSDQFGIQYVSNTGSTIGLVNFNNQVPSLVASAQSGGTVAPSVPLGSSVLVGRITDRDTLSGFGGVINALRNNSNANILSTPVLVTLDNEEASILVGQEVPFISNTQLSASNTNPFQNFERRDVGLSLKVKPQINEGDVVRLELEQEISSILPSAQAVDTITSKRTLKTTVLVEDGGTLVLGGLVDEQENESEQRVPILGDIPLIGYLFRFNTETASKRNLMIFIKPTILRNEDDVLETTTGKYNLIRSRQIRMRDEGSLEEQDKPVLDQLSPQKKTGDLPDESLNSEGSADTPNP